MTMGRPGTMPGTMPSDTWRMTTDMTGMHTDTMMCIPGDTMEIRPDKHMTTGDINGTRPDTEGTGEGSR